MKKSNPLKEEQKRVEMDLENKEHLLESPRTKRVEHAKTKTRSEHAAIHEPTHNFGSVYGDT